VKTEKIHFECVQRENRAEVMAGGLDAWQVKREAEAFRDLIRAALSAFDSTRDKVET